MDNLLTIYNLEASIGTSKSSETWTYAKLENGLDNVSEALNEVVQQYFFLNDKGFARNHVTGMAPTFTFTGRRVQGDAAQDYIFGNVQAGHQPQFLLPAEGHRQQRSFSQGDHLHRGLHHLQHPGVFRRIYR